MNWKLTPLCVFTLLLLSACVTQKKKGEISGVKKAYENMTARYNGYYNADVLWNESVASLQDQHQDNYNKVLPVFEYLAADNPQAVADNLDEAIKKVSVVVSLHRESDWTDDCYLLMAQSQYVKQDFESAEETLEYMVEEYSPSGIERSKTRKEKGVGQKKTAKTAKEKKEVKKVKEKTKKERQKKIVDKKKAAEKLRKQKNKEVRRKRKLKQKGKYVAPKKKKPEPKKDPAAEKAAEEAAKAKAEAEAKAKAEAEAKANAKVAELDQPGLEENADNYFMKHRPAHQEGLLWLAKTYIERENYREAERLLNELAGSGKTYEDVRRELRPTQAHYHIVRQQYDQAIAPLQEAIELAKARPLKARYAFILGQLQEKLGNTAAANAAYTQAAKYSVDYEMQFQSRLQIELNGADNSEAVVRALNRMLKDFKNEDYKDRIYYALAQLYLREGERDLAITNYRKSLVNSSSPNQRGESYYALGDLYFEAGDFVNAKAYFDSTLTTLNKLDERYDYVQRYANNLTEIADNLTIITVQDSLLRISNMSDDERTAMAAAIQQKAEQERIAALKKKNPVVKTSSPGVARTATNSSSFFAYDDSRVRRGKREFQRRYGSRPLEDNWRRSAAASTVVDAAANEIETVATGLLNPEDVDRILKDVPKTDEDRALADQKILEAQYQLGGLFRDKLQSNERTIDILEQMDQRYPGGKYELDAWYLLYLAHTDEGNTAKANEYKRKILDKYAETTYGRILQDPNYVNTLQSEERKLNAFYDEVYTLVQQGRYQQANDRMQLVDEQFGKKNALQARFALLQAMVNGSLKGKDTYVLELRAVMAKFPDTPEATRAREMLRLLGSKVAARPGQSRPGADGESPFKVEDAALHYIVVSFNDPKISLNEAKVAVSDYNQQFHKNDRLRISNILLGVAADNKTPVIVLRRFQNREKAEKYLTGVKNNREQFLSKFDYEVLLITQNNYRQVLKEKSLDNYVGWYGENY